MSNNWTWSRATGQDIYPLATLSIQHIGEEVDSIFDLDVVELARQIGISVTSQFYNPFADLVMVAKDDADILAYVWVKRGEHAAWSTEEVCAPKIAHVDMTLPTRTRIKLIREMINFWEIWACECGIPIICSSSIRRKQSGFLRIHEQMGYDVRGSICYKRLK